MVVSAYLAAVFVPIGVVSVVLVLYIWRRRRHHRQGNDLVEKSRDKTEESLSGVVKYHHQVELESRRRSTTSVYPRGKPLFSWDDQPSLVNDAVENGWSQFAFRGYMLSSPSARQRLLGLCKAGDDGKEVVAEISWEVFHGSADYMQKIRLNPGLKRAFSISHPTVIRTALPLPGPPLASFPQEAYFEITILSIHGHETESAGRVKEGVRTKLIQEGYDPSASSESSLHSSNRATSIEELTFSGKDSKEEDEGVMFSVGLTAGSSAPSKLPGSFPGSLGFNSNGSVYLDGMKLVSESEKEGWGKAERIIGCGFDPKQKKVFFTVDSELVHVIKCKSEEFGTPLYPTLAANAEISVLVNLGQSVFKYTQAQRTPNPCFVGPLVNAPGAAIGYEDSGELFSMGMLDSQWFTNGGSHGFDSDYESVELFEIVVAETEKSGRDKV